MLTGNTHIFMERDVSSGRYELLQNGKKLKLQEEHFQPIFFAPDVETLRSIPAATKSLKKYRIFVGPDEFVEKLQEKAIHEVVDIATSLNAKMARQREEDLKEFRGLEQLADLRKKGDKHHSDPDYHLATMNRFGTQLQQPENDNSRGTHSHRSHQHLQQNSSRAAQGSRSNENGQKTHAGARNTKKEAPV